MTRALVVINLSNYPNESFDLEIVEVSHNGHVVELPTKEPQGIIPAELVHLDPSHTPDDYILVKITTTGDGYGDHQGVQAFVYSEAVYSKTVLDNGDIHFEQYHPDGT